MLKLTTNIKPFLLVTITKDVTSQTAKEMVISFWWLSTLDKLQVFMVLFMTSLVSILSFLYTILQEIYLNTQECNYSRLVLVQMFAEMVAEYAS